MTFGGFDPWPYLGKDAGLTVADVDAPAALALRRLQLLDQRLPWTARATDEDPIPAIRATVREAFSDLRALLLEAETHLGAVLGLVCTGTGEPPNLDHSDGTCPIHEWLVPADCPDA